MKNARAERTWTRAPAAKVNQGFLETSCANSEEQAAVGFFVLFFLGRQGKRSGGVAITSELQAPGISAPLALSILADWASSPRHRNHRQPFLLSQIFDLMTLLCTS